MADSSSIDSHIKAYADLFIEKFDSIAGDWRQPWLPTLPFSAQNAEGHLYSGVNDVNLSLVSALKGYEVPLWLTSSHCRGLDVMRLRGESGTLVYWGGTAFVEKATGKVDSQMRWADWRRLSPAEKDRYTLKESVGTCTYVWNIQQTDFPEKHPDAWADLKAAFSREKNSFSEKTLDDFLQKGSWYPDDCHCCAVIQSDCQSAQYNRTLRCIEIPRKELFRDKREFYNTLLHTLAHSAIIEQAYATYKGEGSPLEGIARLNLASELSAAVVAGRLGMSQTLSEGNLQYLKQWSQMLSDDPAVIRQVARESRYAVQLLSERLNLGEREIPDVCASLSEQIRSAREERKIRFEDSSKRRRVHSETNERTGKPRLSRGAGVRM